MWHFVSGFVHGVVISRAVRPIGCLGPSFLSVAEWDPTCEYTTGVPTSGGYVGSSHSLAVMGTPDQSPSEGCVEGAGMMV